MRRPSHWPSGSALMLLRAGLWDGDAAARAWHQVVRTVDIETLEPGAARLLPLVHRNVRRLGLQDPWSSRMRGIHRYWWAHNRQLLRLCSRALDALGHAGISTMVLKGVPLGLVYYGNLAERPMSDFDVLIHRRDTPAAIRVLAGLGWFPERAIDERLITLRHGVSLHDRGGRTLDLHWAIHEEDVKGTADEDAWSTAVPLEVDGVPTLMLAPAPLLVHAMAAGAKWAADTSVQWAADASLILRRGDVDCEAIAREARARRFVVRLRSCLAYLRVALDVAIPDDLIAELAAAPVSRFEILEHRIRTQRQNRLGELPRYWLAWSRTAPTAWRDPLGFGRYLQTTWELPSLAELPLAAGRRAWARLLTGRPIEHSQRSQSDTAASTSRQ